MFASFFRQSCNEDFCCPTWRCDSFSARNRGNWECDNERRENRDCRESRCERHHDCCCKCECNRCCHR
ncbi:MAG: hypothetical protein SPF92_09315 [Clostridia bacterium]|nr:hypothetical protein [Clostridia bacterium]